MALPVELYVECLLHLPCQDPAAVKTVVSFLSANSVTRAAALDRSLWAKLYLARYIHNVPEQEDERRARLKGDWQKMFFERARLDRAALKLVDHIRAYPEDHDAASHRLVCDFSWDVWDALELEKKVPIPLLFRDFGVVDAEDEMQEVVPHALPRRFWAKAVLGAIGRNYAVRAWARILKNDESCIFEDVLTGLSAFVGVSPRSIFEQLDQLARQCRDNLIQDGLVLQPTDPDYDLAKVAVSVRNFIQREGFGVATDPMMFYFPFNQFPHHFLTIGRSTTLPISVSYVYLAICRRMQIKGSPTNTARRVLCYIESPNLQQDDILIDPSSTADPVILSDRNVPNIAGLQTFLDTIKPANLTTMVNRAVQNMFATMHNDASHVDPLSGCGMDRVRYAASAAFATINAHGVQITPMVTEDCPLDFRAVVMDALFPVVPENLRKVFLSELATYTAKQVKYKVQPPRCRVGTPLQDLDWFVGLALDHPTFGEACVIGWKIGGDGEVELQVLMKDAIENVSVRPDVAGHCWAPAPLTLDRLRHLRSQIFTFERFFENAHIPRGDGTGGRLVPVLELQIQYPEDLTAGARWTNQQLAIAQEAGT